MRGTDYLEKHKKVYYQESEGVLEKFISASTQMYLSYNINQFFEVDRMRTIKKTDFLRRTLLLRKYLLIKQKISATFYFAPPSHNQVSL